MSAPSFVPVAVVFAEDAYLNRKALEAVVRYAHDEGMIKTKPKIEELFFSSTLQEIGQYLS